MTRPPKPNRRHRIAVAGRLLIVGLLGLGCMVLLLGPVTWWATPVNGLQAKDLADVRNSTRQILLAAVGGLAILIGLAFTARTYFLTRRGQLTNRYATAVSQLASDKITERLGGIYALEHIMIESERDHDTVIEVLAAFIREQAQIHFTTRRPLGRSTRLSTPRFRPAHRDDHRIASDVQAALTVLARRPNRHERNPPNLKFTDLRGADLEGARLDHADLESVDLRHSDLTAVQLRHANLLGARFDHAQLKDAQFAHANLGAASLRNATLWKANLQSADLVAANLAHANLPDTDLRHANLGLADLSEANLSRADLRGATLSGQRDHDGAFWRLDGQASSAADLVAPDGLTPSQLADAIIDDTTILPPSWKDTHHSAPPHRPPTPEANP